MSPKLSVLIPVWNQEELILRALDSVPRRDDIEILICDDASTDGTAAAVRRYMEENPDRKIRFFQQTVNRGEGAARNVLFDQAAGEYIASLDSDDYFYTEELEKAIHHLDGTDLVYIVWKWNNGRVLNLTPANRDYYCGLTLRLIRREFLGDLRCKDVRYAADKSLSSQLEKLPHTEKYTGLVVYHYNAPRRGSLVNLKERGFDTKMYDNVFYYGHVCTIGGVETFFYEIARKYADWDLTLLYKSGDSKQLQRIAKYIRVKRWNGEKIKCRKLICGYSFEPRDLDMFEAEEYIQVIHADFVALKGVITPKLDKRFRYLAVSENNAVTFEQLTGIRPEVCYNPITLDKPRKVLHLISATRLSPEKGLGRMQKLADALDAAGVRYQWTIYTDSSARINSPNVVYAPIRLDIRDYIADADYLVQLSDTEGYPYSLLEALSLKTPVIVTDLPSNPDSQVVDGVNAWVLPFDMSEIPIEKIEKGLKRFPYKPREDGWGEILVPGVSTWKDEQDRTVTVEAICRYRDLELDDRIFEKGETHECSWERAKNLENKGLARMI